MGTQWNRAGGRARVSRIADLAATILPLSFIAVRLGASWIDRNSWPTLLSSGISLLFNSPCLATVLHSNHSQHTYNHPISQYHQPAPPRSPIKFLPTYAMVPHHGRTLQAKHDTDLSIV